MTGLQSIFLSSAGSRSSFVGAKVVSGDVMIDDYPKNLDHFSGERLIFTQPHNELIENDTYKRVNSWKEIMNIL